jgi:hypothetical protein
MVRQSEMSTNLSMARNISKLKLIEEMDEPTEHHERTTMSYG